MNAKPWPQWYNPPGYSEFGFAERASRELGISLTTIRLPIRHRAVVRVRYAMAHIMKDKLGRSYGEIGHVLDRDHSTIIHGINQSRKLLKTCPRHVALYETLWVLG